MSTGTRLRSGTVYGTLSDALLTNSSGAVTMNSVGLGTAFVPAISGAQYMPVILDPQQQIGAPEIVWVTAHTGSATAATVVRAQEGSTLRAHNSGEFWVAGPTPMDSFPWNWTAYTPTWTAVTSNPSVGNGTLTSAYMLYGSTCFLSIYLAFGSTTSGGKGAWSFTLPSGITSAAIGQSIPALILTTGNSVTALWNAVGQISPSSTSLIPATNIISTSSNMLDVQNTDSTGAGGTGVPNVGGGDVPFKNLSSITISGAFQTA